ncbi:MAG: hypothetical protein AAFY98_01465 [Verrucomicrobiota bacterium]
MSDQDKWSDLFAEICNVSGVWGLCRFCEKYVYDSHFPEKLAEEDIDFFISSIHHLMIQQAEQKRNIPYFLFCFDASVITVVRFGKEYIAVLLNDIEKAEAVVGLVQSASEGVSA